MLISSIVFSLITIGFFILIFTDEITIILLGLIIYNLIIHYLYIIKKYLYNEQVHLKIINTLTISLTILTLYFNYINYIDNSLNILNFIILLSLFYNIYYSLNNINNNNYIYNRIYPVMILILFLSFANITTFNFNLIIKQTLILISFFTICIYDLYKFNKIKLNSFIWITISNTILYFISLYNNVSIYPYIITILYTILSLISFIYYDSGRKTIAYLFTISLIYTLYNIVIYYDLSKVYLIIISLLIFIIPLLNIKLNYFIKTSFTKISNLSLILSTITYLPDCNYYILTILTILISIIYLIYNFKNNIKHYKIISYIYLTISLFSFIEILNIPSINIYIIPFMTIIIILSTIFIDKLKDDYNHSYIILSIFVSIIILNIDINIIKLYLNILLNISFIYYIYSNNHTKEHYYISAISIIPSIYYSDIFMINNINLMYFISLILISIITYLSYKKENINIYTKLSYLYTIIHIFTLSNNRYISLILFLIISAIHYLSNNNGWKDFFKFLIYSSILILYIFIKEDLYLYYYTLFDIGGYLIYSIITIRTILIKYVDSYKNLEYTSNIILNLIAIINYSGEYDGMLFVTLLVVLTIIGYVYKLGPTFIVSIIFIIINVLLLTRVFWLSIPWWLYILFIGTILIAFAINNELNSNKDKTIKSKLDDMKNKLDL